MVFLLLQNLTVNTTVQGLTGLTPRSNAQGCVVPEVSLSSKLRIWQHSNYTLKTPIKLKILGKVVAEH